MSTPDASLIDVMFAVCTTLDRIGERALLVGGSAATYYAPAAYQSLDCDFILTFGVDSASIVQALASIGFVRAAEGFFKHPATDYTVEFPRGPAYIGTDEITVFATERRDGEVLYLYTPTDVVRDRIMHYWAWGDYSALRVALDVATARRSDVRYDIVADWMQREIDAAPAAYDAVRRDLALADLRAALRG